MRLFRGRREIERKIIALGDLALERPYSFTIPKGSVYELLELRLSGTVTNGVAAATSLQPGGMEKALRRLELNAEFAGLENISGPLRSYTARGVNDTAGGRTASMAGRMLAFENRVNRRTAPDQTDPGTGVAAHPVNMCWTLDLAQPNTPRGWQTALDLRGKGDGRLDVSLGVLEAAAAGDDTDLLVTAPTTTSTFSGYLDLVAITINNPPPGFNYLAWHTRPLEVALSVSGALKLALDAGRNYRRLYLICSDNDVLSDARVDRLTVTQDNILRPIDNDRWTALRGDAKSRYAVETLVAGTNVAEFDPDNIGQVLDTRGGANFDMYLDVPAGAAAAADKLFVSTHELVHPVQRVTVPGIGAGRRRRFP